MMIATKLTLLVPLDGSRLAEAALPYAETLARATQGSLRLLRVLPLLQTDADLTLLTLAPEVCRSFERERTTTAERYLEGVVRALAARGVPAAPLLATGKPAETIVETANSLDADLIVMGTHGESGLERGLVGSVADKVMRLGTRPTLLVQGEAGHVPARAVTLMRVLVPLDGSVQAEAALQPAAVLAVALGASVSLVHVVSWPSALTGDISYAADLSDAQEGLATGGKAYLDRVRTQLPPTLPVEAFLLRGGTAPALLSCVRKQGVDLVVMSTHGRGGFQRFILGSTADRLVRSGVPVLLLRSGGHASTSESQGAARAVLAGAATPR